MWECRNDKHLNSDGLVECEICGGGRPKIRLFYTDQVVDISKPLTVHWHVEDASTVKILYLDKQLDEALVGKYTLEDISSIAKIKLLAKNSFADVLEEISITVPAPEIVGFDCAEPSALVGSRILLGWNVKNARRLEITGIEGSIPFMGKQFITVPMGGQITLVATNESGDVYQDLSINILPACDIIFRVKAETILIGGYTEISWEVKNAHSAKLQTSTSLLEIPLKGSELVSPTEHESYRLLVTALDLKTVTEQVINVTVIEPIYVRHFRPERSYVQKGQSTYLEWTVNNSTELTILPNQVNVTGLVRYEVSPEATTIYTLTAKNALLSVSTTCKIDVGRAPTPMWKPITTVLGIIVLMVLGWLYSGYHNHKIIKDEVYKHYRDGQKLASIDCDRAADAFRQAFDLNSKLSPESRFDSLNISAEQYELDGNEKCEAYGSSSPNIRYIIECNYKLAAALRGNAQTQTCK